VNKKPRHEGSSGMHTLLHDVFPIHDHRVDEGGSQRGVEVEVVHQDQQSPIEGAIKFVLVERLRKAIV
jgi:hypothetical protein